MRPIKIVHMYPDEMNIYGDWGNIVALRKRLQWRGYDTDYKALSLGDDYDFTSADIVFGGGGQDKGQIAVADDLQRHNQSISKAIDSGVVFLLVCGMYQLFGHRFTTQEGDELPGVGVFDAETIASDDRLIGNVVVQSQWGELIGFENHSGKTYLNPGQSALGRVVKGYGNTGEDSFEGAISSNAFGTYMHGPLLPKNPEFADELLKRALEHKGSDSLDGLDDAMDNQIAHQAAHIARTRPQ